MTCSHREAELRWCSPSSAASPPAPCGSRRKRALFRSTWIYVGEPEAAGDGNGGPSRLAVARGFWQSTKWAQWVTMSFPVSLPLYSLFNVSLSQPAFIYCPSLPARITSSNRKQMSSSKSEVAALCPSHHQGNTSDIHFHIVMATICLLKMSFWSNAASLTNIIKDYLPDLITSINLGSFKWNCWWCLKVEPFSSGFNRDTWVWLRGFDFVPESRCFLLLTWQEI